MGTIVEVQVRDNNVDQALRALKKKMQREGNFREMRGTYSLEAGQGRVMVRYAGRLVPDFFVPPVVGTLALRRNVEATFRALVGEMERQPQKP